MSLIIMNNSNIQIKEYNDRGHRAQVVSLWRQVFGYKAAHNNPELVIDKKAAVNDGLFFVAVDGQDVIGAVIAGYDGHRGWIYALAVLPAYQKQEIGSALLAHAEVELSRLDCIKINLQIVDGNDSVKEFYRAKGYMTEKIISMSKCLTRNITKSHLAKESQSNF